MMKSFDTEELLPQSFRHARIYSSHSTMPIFFRCKAFVHSSGHSRMRFETPRVASVLPPRISLFCLQVELN